MPFPEQNPNAFTRTAIEALNSDQTGVYGLYRQDVWIYVGRGDIRARLLDHLNGDNPCITREQPTGWVSEVTMYDVTREQELIRELRPACNQRVG